MSQIVIDRFLRNKFSHHYNLHAYEKLILFFLASYMGNKSICYPSLKSLAIDCNLSIDSIKRHIKSLEKKELIKVTRVFGRNNQYTFNLKLIEQLSADSAGCPQHLGANSATHQGLLALSPGADSSSNNKSNNFIKSTSIRNVDKLSSVNEEASTTDMLEIFHYWKTVMNYPDAQWDKHRQKIVKNALSSYSKDDLNLAIDGCALSSYHMGRNDSGQFHNDIELILRNSKNIERFINIARVDKPSSFNGYRRPEFLKGAK